ncbi:hypothetical protein [Streptomyces sp. NPDC057131]|uniref:Alp7A family actin-like protein n=1 Tax=Streptomyces sp. NPDC057131 TaxID=3346027 RepID=UPI0036D3164C
MKIERMNIDFGNSTNNCLFDGYYFEFPTSVVEVPKGKADSILTNSIESTEDLKNRLLVSTTVDGEERFYMVGKLAEDNPYSNSHVGHMHNKISSHIPYVTFVTSLAYYFKINSTEETGSAEIDIENMKMMLPLWLLKKEEKFSIAQSKMVKRFVGEHAVKLHTPGMETELTIKVKNAKCFNESEVARWALNYKIVNNPEDKGTKIVKREEAEIFKNNETVLNDIGGGSTDVVLLSEGLSAPISKDSFQVIQITPYLGQLEKLLKEKLLEHFSDLRNLENFIVKNYHKQKYVLSNPNSGKEYDLTQPIVEMLREYAELLVFKVMQPFSSNSKRELFYIYIGGETPILKPYIQQAVVKLTNENIMEKNHLFLEDYLVKDENEVIVPTARTINLIALEILSLNELIKQKVG